MNRYVWYGLLASLVGCGGGRPPPAEPPPLDLEEDERPRVRIGGVELPRMPYDVEPDDGELETGWARTAESLLMRTPTPPSGDEIEIDAWASAELAAWLDRRGRSVAAAQRALETARGGRPEHSVVASMLLGLAYSRFALDVRGIATPTAFSGDPDRTAAFRAALEQAAAPLWQRALDAFGSCASVARDQPAHSLAQWRERCDAEARIAEQMLPSSADD